MYCEGYILIEGQLVRCNKPADDIVVFKSAGIKSIVLCEDCLSKLNHNHIKVI